MMAATRRMKVAHESFPLKKPFRITGHQVQASHVVVVTVEEAGRRGWGEATGMYYRPGDDVDGMTGQLEAVRAHIESGLGRGDLPDVLPAGGARNALDCALWDLEAKLAGRPVWMLAGLEAPRPLRTTFTIGADTPQVMASDARSYASARALKLKLNGTADDAARVEAVRSARPDVWLGVDANQGLTPDALERLEPVLAAARVALVEQPFAVGREDLLSQLGLSIAIAADESALEIQDLAALVGRVQVVNIKLDKCGGLTAALAMAREARRLGLGVMVGNTVGTSLSMAPATLVGQLCEIVDLDGPVFLTRDRVPAALYTDGAILVPDALWGAPV